MLERKKILVLTKLIPTSRKPPGGFSSSAMSLLSEIKIAQHRASRALSVSQSGQGSCNVPVFVDE